MPTPAARNLASWWKASTSPQTKSELLPARRQGAKNFAGRKTPNRQNRKINFHWRCFIHSIATANSGEDLDSVGARSCGKGHRNPGQHLARRFTFWYKQRLTPSSKSGGSHKRIHQMSAWVRAEVRPSWQRALRTDYWTVTCGTHCPALAPRSLYGTRQTASCWGSATRIHSEAVGSCPGARSMPSKALLTPQNENRSEERR